MNKMKYAGILKKILEDLPDEIPSLAVFCSFEYDLPQSAAVGPHGDPCPVEGTVIYADDEGIILQLSIDNYQIYDSQYLQHLPETGQRVRLTPYTRHHFDGTRYDQFSGDQVKNQRFNPELGITELVVRFNPTQLPMDPPQDKHVNEIVHYLENTVAPDGFRYLSHMLADARASGFEEVDFIPHDRHPSLSSPALRFYVDSEKYKGKVFLFFDVVEQGYRLSFYQGEILAKGLHAKDLTLLGKTLHDAIDDGLWRKIRVEILQDPNNGPSH